MPYLVLTRTMSDNTLLPAATFKPTRLLLETLNGMECAAGLEGADALQVLALEPQPQNWFGWGAALPFRAFKFLWRARGRGDLGECCVGEYRGLMDEGLDQLMCRLHGFARERGCCRYVGHC